MMCKCSFCCFFVPFLKVHTLLQWTRTMRSSWLTSITTLSRYWLNTADWLFCSRELLIRHVNVDRATLSLTWSGIHSWRRSGVEVWLKRWRKRPVQCSHWRSCGCKWEHHRGGLGQQQNTGTTFMCNSFQRVKIRRITTAVIKTFSVPISRCLTAVVPSSPTSTHRRTLCMDPKVWLWPPTDMWWWPTPATTASKSTATYNDGGFDGEVKRRLEMVDDMTDSWNHCMNLFCWLTMDEGMGRHEEETMKKRITWAMMTSKDNNWNKSWSLMMK